MFKHWKAVATIVLGALVGGSLHLIQVLALVVVWFSYFDPTASGVLLSRGAAWNLIEDAVTNRNTMTQVLIGVVLGGVTAFMWMQREQHRRLVAWVGFICGGLLVGVLVPQHIAEAWGDWHTYTKRATLVAAILTDIFELAVIWAGGLMWWGWVLRQRQIHVDRWQSEV